MSLKELKKPIKGSVPPRLSFALREKETIVAYFQGCALQGLLAGCQERISSRQYESDCEGSEVQVDRNEVCEQATALAFELYRNWKRVITREKETAELNKKAKEAAEVES